MNRFTNRQNGHALLVLFFGVSLWATLHGRSPMAWGVLVSMAAAGVAAGLLESGAFQALLRKPTHHSGHSISHKAKPSIKYVVLSKILLILALIGNIGTSAIRDGWQSLSLNGSDGSIGIHMLLFSYFLGSFLGSFVAIQDSEPDGARPAA